jgi:hypothetical protein
MSSAAELERRYGGDTMLSRIGIMRALQSRETLLTRRRKPAKISDRPLID